MKCSVCLYIVNVMVNVVSLLLMIAVMINLNLNYLTLHFIQLLNSPLTFSQFVSAAVPVRYMGPAFNLRCAKGCINPSLRWLFIYIHLSKVFLKSKHNLTSEPPPVVINENRCITWVQVKSAPGFLWWPVLTWGQAFSSIMLNILYIFIMLWRR